jgi:predicted outer membrane protein
MKRKINILAAVVLATGVSFSSFAQQKSSPSSSSSKQSTSSQADADTLFMKRALAIGVAEIEFAQVALQNSNSEKVKNFAQKMIEDHTNANNKLMAIMNGTAEEENAIANATTTGNGMGTGSGTATGLGSGEQNSDTTGAIVSGTNDTTSVNAGGIGSTTGTRSDSASTMAEQDQSAAKAQPAKPAMELKLSGSYLEMKNKLEGMSGAAFDRQYVQQTQKDHNLSIKLLEKYQQEGKNTQLKSWVKQQLPAIRKHQAELTKLSASVGGAKSSSK